MKLLFVFNTSDGTAISDVIVKDHTSRFGILRYLSAGRQDYAYYLLQYGLLRSRRMPSLPDIHNDRVLICPQLVRH